MSVEHREGLHFSYPFTPINSNFTKQRCPRFLPSWKLPETCEIWGSHDDRQTDVSKASTVSITIDLVTKAVRTSQMSVNFCETTRRSAPEDSHLYPRLVFVVSFLGQMEHRPPWPYKTSLKLCLPPAWVVLWNREPLKARSLLTLHPHHFRRMFQAKFQKIISFVNFWTGSVSLKTSMYVVIAGQKCVCQCSCKQFIAFHWTSQNNAAYYYSIALIIWANEKYLCHRVDYILGLVTSLLKTENDSIYVTNEADLSYKKAAYKWKN